MNNVQRVQTGGMSLYVQGEVRQEMRGGFMESGVYTAVLDHTIIACVDAVIINRQGSTFFLAKRAARPMLDHWWWFGGRRNKGESPIQGMRRKFTQEVDLDLPGERFEFIDVLEYIWQEREQHPVERGSHHIAHQFFVELSDQELSMVRLSLSRSREYDSRSGLQEFDRTRILAEELHPAVLQVYDAVFQS